MWKYYLLLAVILIGPPTLWLFVDWLLTGSIENALWIYIGWFAFLAIIGAGDNPFDGSGVGRDTNNHFAG